MKLIAKVLSCKVNILKFIGIPDLITRRKIFKPSEEEKDCFTNDTLWRRNWKVKKEMESKG